MSILSFFTRENITLALAIFGSLGTIGTWLYHFTTTRLSISVEILRAYKLESKASLYVFFQNNSRLPVSISSVYLTVGNIPISSYPIPHTPYAVQAKWENESPKGPEYLTLSMPINLSSLSGASGFLDFYFPQDTLNKISYSIDLHVSTNRGIKHFPELKIDFFLNPSSPGDLI